MNWFKVNVVIYEEERTLKVTKVQAVEKANSKYLVVKSKHFVGIYQSLEINI